MKGPFIKLCSTYCNKIALALQMYALLWKPNDMPIIIGRHIPKLHIWLSTKAKSGLL